MEINVELPGEEAVETLFIGVGAVAEKREEILRAMRVAATVAQGIMEAQAPEESGHLKSTINVGAITYRPGGAGGGGSYEMEISIGDNTTSYLEYVLEGTGIYGFHHSPITPSRGNVMVFHGSRDGKKLFMPSVKGQPAQTEWLVEAQTAAREIIEAAIRDI